MRVVYLVRPPRSFRCGADDDDDPAEAARVAFGLGIRDRLRELDPPAFEMDTWWDRIYEEVELDTI